MRAPDASGTVDRACGSVRPIRFWPGDGRRQGPRRRAGHPDPDDAVVISPELRAVQNDGRYWVRPRLSTPVAWMCPNGSGEIQTFAQAGGIASAPMRRSASRCVTSAPDRSRYRKPSRLRSRVIPGPRGSLRVNPGTAAASDDAPRLMPRQRIRRPHAGTAPARDPAAASKPHGTAEPVPAQTSSPRCPGAGDSAIYPAAASPTPPLHGVSQPAVY
jgi:hypothetical protein